MEQKIVEYGNFTIEISIERKQNGVSSVACIKSFVKPDEDKKGNGLIIDGIENEMCFLVKEYVKESDLLSDNYIMDFNCTRDNLNAEKWSRLTVDLYLFTQFVEASDELYDETLSLCKIVSDEIERIAVWNSFGVRRSVP